MTQDHQDHAAFLLTLCFKKPFELRALQHERGSSLEGLQWIFWLKPPPLPVKLDCLVFRTIASHHTSSVGTCFFFFFLLGFIYPFMYFWSTRLPRASIVLALDGILSVYETLEGLHGLENATRASMDIRESWKRVKFKFWLSYPFKSGRKRKRHIDGLHFGLWPFQSLSQVKGKEYKSTVVSLCSAVCLASAIPLSYKTLCENFKRGCNVETHLVKRKSQSNLFLLSKKVLCRALWRVVQKEKCKVHQLMSSSLYCVLSCWIKLLNRRGKSLNWKNEFNGRKNVHKLWILEQLTLSSFYCRDIFTLLQLGTEKPLYE